VLARGIRDKVLRDDLPGDAVFEMFSAITERALWLAVGQVMTHEQAAEAAATIFLDGARSSV
jgi:TetR/AcrR family transcriptional regulator, mexCD-oprJ operon repressor